MSELKPCPFCGTNDWQYQSHFSGATICQCMGCGAIVDESVINARPIEDELRKRIAELEEANEVLETAYGILQDECSTLYRLGGSDGTLPPEEREE